MTRLNGNLHVSIYFGIDDGIVLVGIKVVFTTMHILWTLYWFWGCISFFYLVHAYASSYDESSNWKIDSKITITQTYPRVITNLTYIGIPHGEMLIEPYKSSLVASWKIQKYAKGESLALKFTSIKLMPNDLILIQSENMKEKQIFYGNHTAKYSLPLISRPFIEGSFLYVRFYVDGRISKSKVRSGSFNITDFITEQSSSLPSSIKSSKESKQESICGSNEMIDISCVPRNDIKRIRSRPIVRLFIQKSVGSVYCTGWLLGCQGHVITNYHCIKNDEEAKSITIEIMAEGKVCPNNNVNEKNTASFMDLIDDEDMFQWTALAAPADQCLQKGGCPGRLLGTANDISFIHGSVDLDYSLIYLSSISHADLRNYGYLKLKNEMPVVNEIIYIPQHPFGFGKQIAINYRKKPGRIVGVNVEICKKSDFSYNLSTDHGSSGSPVIAAKDDNVIGLHHCGGCPNGATPSYLIIQDLKKRNILPKCSVA